MNIILQTCVFILVAMAVNASERVPRAAGKNCPRDIEFPKGVSCKRCVKYRRRGTQVVLKCPKGFGRYGNKRLSCGQDNKWKGDYPVCVKSGCAPIDTTNDVNLVMSLHPKFDDAVVTFQCEDEYVLFGPTEIHCDGVQWSHAPPKCEAITDLLECDFEYGLCGWTEQQRVQANQNWTRHLGSTQTGGTGPKRDHTFPNSYTGHYLYFESSAPTIEGDTAVLASPPYTPDLSPMCFEFWYHMLGPDDQGHVGSLSVYVLNEGQQMDDKQPEYYKEGNQGDVWHKGDIFIDSQIDTYQILIKATRKKSYMSDIAIDDVRLYNCTQSTTTTTITTTTTTSTTPTTPTTVSVPSTRTSITTASIPSASTSLSADGSNLTSAIVSLTSSTAIPQSTTNSSKIQQSTILEISTTPSINKTVITEGSTMSSTKQAISNIVTTVMTPSTTSNMVMSSSKSGIVSTTPAVSVTPSGATSTVALTLETTKLASSSPTGKTMTQGITTRRTSVKSSTSTTELLTTKPADLTTMTKSKTPTIVKQTTKPLTSQAASKLQTATVTLESSSLKVETTSPVPVTKSTTSERTTTPRRTTTAATTPFSLFATKISKYNTRPSSLSPGPVSSQARSSTQTSTTSSSTKSTTKISPPQTSSSHSATTVFGSSVSPRSSSVIATVKSGNSTAGLSSKSKAMTSKLPLTSSPPLSTSKDDKGGKSNITANPARSTHPEDETLKPLMIGLGVGIIVGLIIIGVIGWVCMRRRKFYTSRYEDELKPITNAASTQSLNNVDYYQDDFDIENV